MWETEDDKKTKGPREKAGGGECIYNCEPNDGMFCRVAFEKANFTGKTKGLCFKNQAWCQERCEGYVGGGSPALPPAPDSLDVDMSNIGKKIYRPLGLTSHSAYIAMSTESDGVKIDALLYPNFM